MVPWKIIEQDSAECHTQELHLYLSSFLNARLKNGSITLYPSASVRPSIRPSVFKLFRFRVTHINWRLLSDYFERSYSPLCVMRHASSVNT